MNDPKVTEIVGVIALIITVALVYNWTEFTNGVAKVIRAIRGKD